jgi:hypothetical protein
MAHFARLDENNTVIAVVVVSNADMVDDNGAEIESLGIAVCESVIGPGPWVQTSYNGNFRRQYAGIGSIYDADADVFIRPKPFSSWVLNDQYDWQAPVPQPEGDYAWNEETLSWEPIPTENPAP